MRTTATLLAILLLTGCVSPITERLRAVDVEEPRWNVGDWWRYNVTSETLAVAGDVTVVVAEVLDNGYILGIPDAEGDNPRAALLFHMPAIGPISNDLSWDVHETRFEPIRWPLSDGLEWDTTWITAEVHLQAHLNGTRWVINNSGHEQDAGMAYELVYDPEAKWFSSFVRTGLDGSVRQAMTLLERGTNHTGALRAPQFIEVAFLDSRTQGVMTGGIPAAPNPTFTAPESADTLLVGCLAGGAPGQYRARVDAPSGQTICNLDLTVQAEGPAQAAIEERPYEDGAWATQMLALGQGSATVEVLAWPTLNYTLGT